MTGTNNFLDSRPEYTQDVGKLKSYINMAIDWQATHGLLLKAPALNDSDYRTNAWASVALTPAPVSLAPSPIPKAEFEKVVALQPELNRLFDRIANDHEFLVDTLGEIGDADEFTHRVFKMYLEQHRLGIKKPGTIGIHRSDYMIHTHGGDSKSAPKAKQVEFNTIAASFASLSTIAGNMHRYLLKRTGYTDLLEKGTISEEQLPQNESLTSIGDGISVGFDLYGNKNAIVVMIVQPDERNIYDQRWVETRLWEEHRIRVERLTFAEVLDKCKTDENGRIFLDEKEIAVAYYRSGYAPTDFPTDAEWDGRWLLEKSRAITIPSLGYHLAGCKKVQQVLAQPGIVERFVNDPKTADAIRECFVGLYPLDMSDEGKKAYNQAKEEPLKYVMKPQREGGGYNTYGEDIPKLLSSLSADERRSYILMELIMATGFNNILLRDGQLIPSEVISELGIYGIWVSGPDGKEIINKHGGHLLRTKASDVYEGGVAAGFAVIDSPLLI